KYGPMGLDYSTVTSTSGLRGSPQGNFTSRGPAFLNYLGEPYDRDTQDLPMPVYKAVGLRHHDKMNVAFFDGHVVPLDDRGVSRLQYFVPRGSRVENPLGLSFNSGAAAKWTAGMIVQ